MFIHLSLSPRYSFALQVYNSSSAPWLHIVFTTQHGVCFSNYVSDYFRGRQHLYILPPISSILFLKPASIFFFLRWSSSSKPWKFISCICSVQILHLSSNTCRGMSILFLSWPICFCFTHDQLMLKCFNHWGSNGGFPFFRNLVKLSFECKTKMGWKVLWSLINNSPKLETLILKVHMISLFNYSQGTYDESRRVFF